MTHPTKNQERESLHPTVLFVRSRQRLGKVPLRVKLLQGFGTIPGQHKDWAFNTLLLLYYSQILGLSATVAAFALALSLVIDAVSDPLVGGLSDNFRSSLGRRHAFMLASILPTGLSVYGLFQPPQDLNQTLLAARRRKAMRMNEQSSHRDHPGLGWGHDDPINLIFPLGRKSNFYLLFRGNRPLGPL